MTTHKLPAHPRPGTQRLFTLRMPWPLSRRLEELLKRTPEAHDSLNTLVLHLLANAVNERESIGSSKQDQ